jgi:integrase
MNINKKIESKKDNETAVRKEVNALVAVTKGVDIHGNKPRISFYYQNKRYFEVLKEYPLTVKNIEAAEKKRDNILYRIAENRFDYAEEFPHSKKALKFKSKNKVVPTVKIAVAAFIELKTQQKAHSTYTSYASKSKHILTKWGNHQIDNITPSEIQLWIAVDLKVLSNKTINDIMIIFRGIYDSAIADRIIKHNPFEHIKNLKIIRKKPDPFTTKEINKIKEVETFRQQEVNAFMFHCLTGLRPSELIGMTWSDVNRKNWTVKIQRGNVKSRYKCTKTDGSTRTINLLEPAIKILQKQMKHSYFKQEKEVDVLQLDNKTIKKEKLRMVFLNTTTEEAFPCIGSFTDRFFKEHLKKAGVRYRAFGQARHTFASQLLTAGVNPHWLAQQMGHTSIKMIEKHYGTWMTEEAPYMASQVSELLNQQLNKQLKQ